MSTLLHFSMSYRAGLTWGELRAGINAQGYYSKTVSEHGLGEEGLFTYAVLLTHGVLFLLTCVGLLLTAYFLGFPQVVSNLAIIAGVLTILTFPGGCYLGYRRRQAMKEIIPASLFYQIIGSLSMRLPFSKSINFT